MCWRVSNQEMNSYLGVVHGLSDRTTTHRWGGGSYEGVAEEEGAEEAEETEEAVLPTWPGGGQRHQEGGEVKQTNVQESEVRPPWLRYNPNSTHLL